MKMASASRLLWTACCMAIPRASRTFAPKVISNYHTRALISRRAGSPLHERLTNSADNQPISGGGGGSRPPPRRVVPKEEGLKRGSKVFVEVTSFGPLGASVDVIGIGHDANDIIPGDAEPLGRGLIVQEEIHFFRQGRDVDVVKGEVIPAYVQDVRENGTFSIGLRTFGGKAKAQEIGEVILEKLIESEDGTLPVGDKSTPQEISKIFPGVSKAAFKKAVGALFRKGEVQPSPNSISIMKK